MVKKILLFGGLGAALIALAAAGKRGNNLLEAVKQLKFIPTWISEFKINGLKSLSFIVDLNISNPTAYDLPITIRSLNLVDNGHPLANATPSNSFFDLKANTSLPVKIAVDIQLSNVLANYKNLLNFSLEGKQLMADISVEGVDFIHTIDLNNLK